MAAIHDVFISHAGEDKDSLAEPIYKGLIKLGMRGFLDRSELKVGGDAVAEMEQAMETAPIGLFLLSPEFAMKKWPMKELFRFIERVKEAQESGEGGAVPVLVPVFYRLTVAEARYRQVFKKYHDMAERLRFTARARSGEANTEDVLDALEQLTAYTGIENSENATKEKTGEMMRRRQELTERICGELGGVMTRLFTVPCNVPENSSEVVLDFEGEDEGEEGHASCESKVLEEVICDDINGSGRKIVSIKGAAGVGKSCILRGVGRRDEVKFLFRGGIYYMLLGMDATEETLMQGLLKILHDCGKRELAEKLENERGLDKVLENVRDAMEGKKSLILIDDLWERNGLGPGTVDLVSKVLEKGSGRAVVVTTRSTAVAQKGKMMKILPREVMSAEAERIMLQHARTSAEKVTGRVRDVFKKLQKQCAGLPLCLAVMGRGLGELLSDVGSMEVEVWEWYHEMMKEGEKLIQGDVDEYKSLNTTLGVALVVLEERRGKFEGSGGRLSLREMHRSLCILKKQSLVSFVVLARLWELRTEYEALFVGKAFSGMGLADIEMSSEAGSSGVRLHDLVHDFSVACAKKEEGVSVWHKRVLNGYLREEERVGGLRNWWCINDEVYILANVCWHLWRSGNEEELIELLLSVRWTKVRLQRGGLLDWIRDFSDCAEAIQESAKYVGRAKEALQKGLVLVRDAIAESWPFLRENVRELEFQVVGRLWGCEEWAVEKYKKSARERQEKPCVKPLEQCWKRPGSSGVRGELVMNGGVSKVALDDEEHSAVAGVGRAAVFIDLKEMRAVNTCEGHAKTLGSVAWSSDGRRAFSWSEDGAVREWDKETETELKCLTLVNIVENEGDSEDEFCCGTICPDSNIVVTGSEAGMVQVWHLQSGKQMGDAMGGFKGWVWCVSVSRDGRHIVAGGTDGTLRFWDASTRAQVGSVFRGHEALVSCVTFSPDGRNVLSGSYDKTMRVWDVMTGTQLGEPIRGHRSWVQSVCFSEDGQFIVSGGVDKTVRIWDASTRAQVGRPLRGHTDFVASVAISRDGRFAVSGGRDHTIRVWDLVAARNDAEQQSETERRVKCLDVSPDGRYFVSGSPDGTLRVWDGSTGEQVGDALRAHNQLVSCVAVSPCGNRFVSGSLDRTLRVCAFETRKQVGETLDGHANWVTCVGYSPNGLFIVSGSRDRSVRVWSTATHEQIGMAIGVVREEVVERPGLTPTGAMGVTVGSSHSSVRVCEDLSDESTNAHKSWVMCVKVSANAERIVCALRDGGLCVWDVCSRQLVGVPRSGLKPHIVRLEMSGTNVVRSVNKRDVEMIWRLDDGEGLVPLAGSNDSSYELDGGSNSAWQSGMDDVMCMGRSVRVRGSGTKLATLPANVFETTWAYSQASGVLGVVRQDGSVRGGRLLFLQVVQ